MSAALASRKGRLEPGKGAFGPVGFHIGPQLVGKEAVGAREGLVEASEGRGHGRAARSKAGKLREDTDILWDDLLAKIRPYGVTLALRTAEIQIADQRELGEGGGVPAGSALPSASWRPAARASSYRTESRTSLTSSAVRGLPPSSFALSIPRISALMLRNCGD